jgi:hypothetical protein
MIHGEMRNCNPTKKNAKITGNNIARYSDPGGNRPGTVNDATAMSTIPTTNTNPQRKVIIPNDLIYRFFGMILQPV